MQFRLFAMSGFLLTRRVAWLTIEVTAALTAIQSWFWSGACSAVALSHAWRYQPVETVGEAEQRFARVPVSGF